MWPLNRANWGLDRRKRTMENKLWSTLADAVSKDKPEAYLWDLAHDGVQLVRHENIGVPMYWALKTNKCGTHLFRTTVFSLEELKKQCTEIYLLKVLSHDSAGYPHGEIELVYKQDL